MKNKESRSATNGFTFTFMEVALHKHLCCQKKRRKRGKQDRRGRIPNLSSIDDRPAIVNSKSRIGDWEGDTIIGKGHQGVVTTHIKRKTKYTVLT